MANETQPTQPVPQTDDTPKSAEPGKETAVDDSEHITDPMATIKIEGQTFELDAGLAQNDKTLKVVLQPHFASVENANITREVKGGKLAVTIVKRAQHKGLR